MKLSFFSGVEKVRDLVRHGNYYVALGMDETDDPRPTNDFILCIEVILIPKIKEATDDSGIKKFHLGLRFLEQVNSETLAQAVHKVFPVCISAYLQSFVLIDIADILH